MLDTIVVTSVTIRRHYVTIVIIAIGSIMFHGKICLAEISLLKRGMITGVAIYWDTNIVSSYTEGGDSLRAITAAHLMKTVTTV